MAEVSKTKSSPTQGEAAVKEKPTEPPAPTETAAPETKDIYMVGEKASQAGIAITVLNVQKVNKLQLLTADAGKTYLDIEVLIENVSRDETTPYNSFYFKIKDDTAAEYTTTMDSLTPSLKSGDLVKGDKARGHLAFEVPDTSKGFVVSYEPMVIFGGYKTIRVNLEEKTDVSPEVGTLEIGDTPGRTAIRVERIAITVISVQSTTSMSGIGLRLRHGLPRH